MNRFVLAAAFGLIVVISLIDLGNRSAGQTKVVGNANMQKCAEECSICQRACDSCATHCSHMLAQGKKEHQVTLQTCLDCATHCSAAATIMAREGPFSDLICKACAEACARCGKECEKHSGDAQMRQCAEACRRCEKACRDMLAQMDGKTTGR
jgi:hypothetical protein